jgi:hypothetical protein
LALLSLYRRRLDPRPAIAHRPWGLPQQVNLTWEKPGAESDYPIRKE